MVKAAASSNISKRSTQLYTGIYPQLTHNLRQTNTQHYTTKSLSAQQTQSSEHFKIFLYSNKCLLLVFVYTIHKYFCIVSKAAKSKVGQHQH